MRGFKKRKITTRRKAIDYLFPRTKDRKKENNNNNKEHLLRDFSLNDRFFFLIKNFYKSTLSRHTQPRHILVGDEGFFFCFLLTFPLFNINLNRTNKNTTITFILFRSPRGLILKFNIPQVCSFVFFLQPQRI